MRCPDGGSDILLAVMRTLAFREVVALQCAAWRGKFKLFFRMENAMIRLIGMAVTSALIAGCASMGTDGPSATAELQATKGNTAGGSAKFTQKGDKVLVTARISGLAPGSHGFHIHEKGDCSSGDGMSAGGHFNPASNPHAHPSTPARHVGDMPMLVADSSGNATLTVELDVMTIGSGPNDIIGKGLIVHKDPDDFKTQPTGNAGARLACGVIRKS
jgi:Cu-Zn family superoxide dismutase